MPKPKNPAYEYIPDARGIERARVRITCEQCGKSALVRTDGHRRFCSKSCAVLTQHAGGLSRQAKGSEHYAWKGSAAGYQALHNRVIRARGRADHCELRESAGCKSITYEWAHTHDTDPGDPQNYRSLCKTCHQGYDKQTGADHARARLTDEQVGEIRERYAAGGVSQQALADEYGVDQTTISRVVLEQTYRQSA